MSKQTAVEWVIEQYINKNRGLEVFMKAKEMEKEQMWEYIKKIYCIGHKSLEFHRLEFEQYYNETYKKDK
jgi:ABC-type siderophore export system fused ATPase/permease subunit